MWLFLKVLQNVSKYLQLALNFSNKNECKFMEKFAKVLWNVLKHLDWAFTHLKQFDDDVTLAEYFIKLITKFSKNPQNVINTCTILLRSGMIALMMRHT